MERDTIVKIGYVMKTHGLKGEVTANLYPGAPEIDIQQVLIIEHSSGLVPYFLTSISIKGSKVYMKLEGVNSIEESELLKGCSIFMEKSKRPKLQRGEFYDDELFGFEVYDVTNGKLGKVLQVINQGLSRLIEVGDKSILIPLDGPFIKSISKTKKKIEVELPEGFLDI